MTLTPEEREAVERTIRIWPTPWKYTWDGLMVDADGDVIESEPVTNAKSFVACVNFVARSLVK